MLLSISEARTRLLDSFSTLGTERIPTEQASNRVLARAVTAGWDYPMFDNSSMDGFALRAEDVAEATQSSPVKLTVTADIPAGAPSSIKLGPGESARIMTGAPLPLGANAVIPVEKTDFGARDAGTKAPDSVGILQSVGPGDYVRLRGEDIKLGAEILARGIYLRAQEIGMAAMLGQADLEVYRKPRVAILSSGDELLSLGEDREPGKIFESNAYTLAALVEDAGAQPVRLGIARDTREDVQKKLDQAAAENVDVIISSAGVSVGAFDFVRIVVEENGSLDFWRVNMRPGKPLAFGNYAGIPFFGLPGNPVSAFVGFEVFVRPALYKMIGRSWERRQERGVLADSIRSDGRESYLRVRVKHESEGRTTIHLTGHQGSGNQLSLVQANALMIIPAGVTTLSAGATVDYWPI